MCVSYTNIFTYSHALTRTQWNINKILKQSLIYVWCLRQKDSCAVIMHRQRYMCVNSIYLHICTNVRPSRQDALCNMLWRGAFWIPHSVKVIERKRIMIIIWLDAFARVRYRKRHQRRRRHWGRTLFSRACVLDWSEYYTAIQNRLERSNVLYRYIHINSSTHTLEPESHIRELLGTPHENIILHKYVAWHATNIHMWCALA